METTNHTFKTTTKGLDINSALINFDGNIRFYLKILSSVKRQYSDTANELQLALNNNDLISARQILHTLKGILGSIGASKPLQQVVLLQEQIHSGHVVGYNLLNSFKQTFNETLSDINLLLEQELISDIPLNKKTDNSFKTPADANNTRPQTILVVDDSRLGLFLAEGLLNSEYQVLTAQNGQTALNLLKTTRPDLILLDIMMPEMDGYAVCKEIKKLPLAKHIPIIFLTAKSDHQDETYGFSLGAVDYISKPINPDVLRSRVKTHLDLKNAYNELNSYKNNLEKKVQEEIKKRQENEKLLLVQSRFAAMGEMIDAIAHQWKQPLNILSLNSQMLLYDYHLEKINAEYIIDYQKDFMLQINHLTSTLDEFRKFFRPDQKVTQFDLSKTLKKVCVLLKADLLARNIDYNVNTEKFHGALINGNENEFKHIFINLINNSRDAFIHKNIHPRMINFEFISEKNNLMIKIKDNAGGIAKEVLDNIFNANVTTKKEAQGGGIGLYMSQQISLKHHAKLFAENIDDGACFTLLIPT